MKVCIDDRAKKAFTLPKVRAKISTHLNKVNKTVTAIRHFSSLILQEQGPSSVGGLDV